MTEGQQSAATLIPMMNVHSHAFQRAMRGEAERPSEAETDDFWSWREAMFNTVDKLGPDSMYNISLTVYTEMVNAGYGTVGEFHYVHHQANGRPYEEPNVMAIAVAEAAQRAGIRIVLLPAAYNRNGWRDGGDVAPSRGQRRFCDRDVDAFLARVDALRSWASHREGIDVGIAAHSVRAVPATWLAPIAEYADRHGLVRHVHAQEQPREIQQCQAEHGCSPLELLEANGFLGPRTTVVHATHVSDHDVAILASTKTIVAACPTTEANLGDGYIPAVRFRDAGVQIAIGTDSNVRIDPFEELRELETMARRSGLTRRALLARTTDLWSDVQGAGAASLGVSDDRTLCLDLDHPTIRGIDRADLPYALVTCADAGAIRRATRWWKPANPL